MADFLVIDDDRSIRRSLELQLTDMGHSVLTAGSSAEGHELWEQHRPDLIILDLVLPDGDGLELLTASVDEELGGMVILITGHQDLDKAITAMRSGAFDYIHKPLDIDELEFAISRALKLQHERKRLSLVADLAMERHPDKIVGQSRAIIEIHKQIGLASRSLANVLIRGESGTGKELVARGIHRHSTPGQPFIPLNCSALTPTLLESELFGHEKGAFTGAVSAKPGRFELAGMGCLFLDEIGDMDQNVQVKLLRVIQNREFERVGGTRSLPFKARLIAATHQDLEGMVRRESFREDLYYRLKVIQISLPPLRGRKEDIPLLVEHLLARINLELRRAVTEVPSEVMRRLVAHRWQGNVRELENCLMAGVIASPGNTLQLDTLQFESAEPKPPGESHSEAEDIDAHNESRTDRSLADIEREHISEVLKSVEGHLGKACEILKISRPTLRKKIKQYGL